MQGGLDLVTPAIALEPGRLIACSNMEPDAGGYRRFAGYERFDGRPEPHKANYWRLDFTGGSTAISEDDVLTASGTAIALRDAVVTSGSWGGADAAGYVYVYDLSGTVTGTITVSASPVATVSGAPVERDADTVALDRTLLAEAQDKRRDLIAAVPGSGPVRGVFSLAGSVYAIRDNAGATAGVMHKATSSGWAAQTFGHRLAFTGGDVEPTEGATITKSGVSAVVRRVVVQSGDWATNDAVGYLVIDTIAGGNFTAGAMTSGATLTVSGAETAIALPAGGRYEIIVHNFFGAAKTERAYLVNGVGRAHEWDGAALVPIETGLSANDDKPAHVAEYAGHLCLGYTRGAVQTSGTGDPLTWTASAGAVEFSTGGQVTGLVRTNTSLVVLSRDRIDYLTGRNVEGAPFGLEPLSEDSGGVPYSLVLADEPIYADGGAIRGLSASDTLGGWRMSSLSRAIEPLVGFYRRNGIALRCVQRVRSKDILRFCYGDKTVLSLYLGRQQPEYGTLELGVQPNVAWSARDRDDNETQIVGADDGFVYRMDVGQSFDGVAFTSAFRLGFMHAGTPTREKRFVGIVAEMENVDPVSLSYSAEYDYGSAFQPTGTAAIASVSGGDFWDEMVWEQFTWDAPLVGEAHGDLAGVSRNITLAFRVEDVREEPWTMSAVTLHFTFRGVGKRRV